LTRAIFVAVLLAVGEVFAALPSLASCAAMQGGHSPLAEARVAFVGTVISIANDQHRALVQVESVWVGPAVPAEVEVQSDVLPAANEGIEDIASFDQGKRYLFVPDNWTEPFKFPGCDGPEPYTQALELYRPKSAHSPEALSAGLSVWKQGAFSISAQAPLLIALVLMVVGALTVAARRIRRRAMGSPSG
jgi:hypothetical protein